MIQGKLSPRPILGSN